MVKPPCLTKLYWLYTISVNVPRLAHTSPSMVVSTPWTICSSLGNKNIISLTLPTKSSLVIWWYISTFMMSPYFVGFIIMFGWLIAYCFLVGYPKIAGGAYWLPEAAGGWWLIHPSEKYESQWGWDDNPYIMENKTCLKPTTSYIYIYISHYITPLLLWIASGNQTWQRKSSIYSWTVRSIQEWQSGLESLFWTVETVSQL